MAAATEIERSPDVLDVAQRYLRRERPLNYLLVVVVVTIFLGTYLATSLLPAVGVGALLLVVTRTPLFQSSGTVQLRTADDPDTVVEEFSGPTPPILAIQWGVADDVKMDAGAATYTISFLFGRRSVEMDVDTHTERTPDGAYLVESVVTVNGQSWATYTSTIRSEDDRTSIDVEYASNRRVDLRSIPQYVVARRYRDEFLAVQGYTVVERDAHVDL